MTPTSLFRPLRAANYQLDWHTPIAPQAALANFIAEGLLARHIRRMHTLYRERHHPLAAGVTLLTLCQFALPAGAVTPPAEPPRGLESSTAAPAAPPHSTPGFLFGYGSVPVTGIDEALRRFRACLPPR